MVQGRCIGMLKAVFIEGWQKSPAFHLPSKLVMASGVTPIRRELVEILRSTLRHLEETEDLQPDDPALLEIKSSILRAIAELEIMRSPSAA